MTDVVQLDFAVKNGLRHYFTGEPCAKGHISKRFTSDRSCMECRAAAIKEKRRNNAEFRGRSAAENTEYQRNRYQNDPEFRAQKLKRCKAQYEKSPELTRARGQRRRAIESSAKPIWHGEFDEFVEQEAAALVIARTQATGIRWEVDHMIPLSAQIARGFQCATNLQVIPMRLNRSKNNAMKYTEPLEWICKI